MSYRAGVVGATGFAGIEAVYILAEHPNFELQVITSDANAGQKLSEVYPTFKFHKLGDMVIEKNDTASLKKCDVVFLAVPHKAALSKARELLDAGVVVIDLSADFRLSDPAIYEKWYGVEHTELSILDKRCFGLPELFGQDMQRANNMRERGDDVLVACAGCYVTASTLASKPFVDSEFFDETMPPIIDAISGYTGAGKNPGERGLYVCANDNYEAYGVTKHRHTPEIEQILGGQKVVFTPHLAPANRGILATVTMKIEPGINLNYSDLRGLYDNYFADSTFVRLLDEGTYPKTRNVAGTNFCEIGLGINEDAGVVIAISAIDNLVKGAAGQAVQCANIVFGLREDAGLTLCGLPI